MKHEVLLNVLEHLAAVDKRRGYANPLYIVVSGNPHIHKPYTLEILCQSYKDVLADMHEYATSQMGYDVQDEHDLYDVFCTVYTSGDGMLTDLMSEKLNGAAIDWDDDLEALACKLNKPTFNLSNAYLIAGSFRSTDRLVMHNAQAFHIGDSLKQILAGKSIYTD